MAAPAVPVAPFCAKAWLAAVLRMIARTTGTLVLWFMSLLRVKGVPFNAPGFGAFRKSRKGPITSVWLE